MKRTLLLISLFILCLLAILPAACDNQAEPAEITTPARGVPTSTRTAEPTMAATGTLVPTVTATPVPDTLAVTLDDGLAPDDFLPQEPLTLIFNQPMNPGRLRLPLIFSTAISGDFSWNDDYTRLTFTPDNGFVPGRSYQVTLRATLKSATGLSFDRVPRWRLVMRTAPEVIERLPSTREIANRQPEIRLRFNRPMDRESVAAALHVEPAIPFTLAWQGNLLTITPEERLANGTTYHFTLDKTAVDQNGDSLVRDYEWSYKLKGALARAVQPTTNQPPSPIILHFNYAITPQSLNRALVIEPAIVGDLTWDETNTIATFTPAARWPASADYTLRFNAPLRDAYGEELPPLDPINFTTPPPIVATIPEGTNVNPATMIRVTFDRPMDEAVTAASFHITPTVTGDLTWNETTLVFRPDEGLLAENTDYDVTIEAGARGLGGEAILNEAYTWSFRTGQIQDVADFGWGPNAQVVDVNGRRAIQYQLYNRQTADVTFELYRLSLEQFLDRYASGFRGIVGWENNRPISTEGTTLIKSWFGASEASGGYEGNIRELIFPNDVLPGLYILNLKAGHINDQLIVALTQNTLTVKQAENQIIAWVTDINGDPLPGIEVSVYARDGRLISSGPADDRGVYRTGVPEGVNVEPLIVIARSGDDITASGLTGEWGSAYSYWSWWEPRPETQDYTAYVYTDRPIYRPGQTVFFKAIIRQDDDAILSLLPEGSTVTARIRDARDNVVQTFQLVSNHFGTVNGQFQLAEGAMLGKYAVEITLPAGNGRDGSSHRQVFKVQDYRKPDYQVTVSTDATRYHVGDTIAVTVDSRYFFGEPVPNADLVIKRYTLSPNYWWEGGAENNDGGAYTWYEYYSEPITGRTDENGRFTFTISASAENVSYYNSYYEEWGSSLQRAVWGIEATVDDGSHQTVSGYAMVNIYNAAEKVHLDSFDYFQEPGQPFTVHATVKTVNDEPVAGRSLSLTLRRWDASNGNYSTVVQSAALTTDSNGRASLPSTINQPGHYQVRVEGQDRLGHPIGYTSWVYAFKEGAWSDWYSQNSNKLKIAADRDSYAPGDTARLLIESSFSGPALLTFERGTTRREQLVHLTAPATVVDVTIQPDDAPNIYVTVNAWEAQDTTLRQEMWESLADSQLYLASVELVVPVTDKTLTVTITPDKETYAPRQEATFTVRVTNGRGEPVSAEVSLAMVDEAIFALSEELSGPIFDGFYFRRGNIVRTYDSLALTRYLGGGGGGGGGGDLIGNPRQDFPDTAAWFPVLHTDFNGEASVTVTLPDSLTSWRLTAKATTADTQVGETVTNITTKQDVIVRPILPRTLTAGDQVALSAIVHNYSDTAQEIAVQLTIDDSVQPLVAFTIHNSPLQTITLAPGELRVVGWPVTALAAGEAQILIRADVGDRTVDAVQLPLTIRPLAIPDVTTQVGQFTGTFNTTVEMPAAALPMSSVRLELSRSIAGSLLEGLEYLTGFPYGCVEQTMSRALPNAVVGRALNQLGVSNPTLQADLPAMINASLQRLYGYQHNDGGWGWWYDDSTHDYQTAWVIFGLATMAEAGYEVDSGVIERGVTWLNDNLNQMDIRTRAYALYSMAVAGHPNVEATLALTEQLEELDTFSQAGLALALHEAGETAEAREIVDKLAETAVNESGRVYWAGEQYDGYFYQKTMTSATRSTALALSAFAQIRPGHDLEPGIVRWLMGQRRQDGWGSTNETSYAILGLTDHLLAASFSEAATATEYSVLVNGQAIASGSLGRGEPAVSLEIPAEQLQAGANQLQITGSGSGRLYYTINSRVYLAQEEIAAAGDVQVSRAYLDPETDKPIETAEPGQLVKVQVTVVMPEAASYVIVEDSLPGGLEALNESLNTTSHDATAADAWEDPHYWQEAGYNYKEIHGDRVSFFITEMNQGPRTFTYFTRATHAGHFVAMPAEVYAMYDLTTWGRSASGRLVIATTQ